MGRNDETGRGNPPQREDTPATNLGRAVDPSLLNGGAGEAMASEKQAEARPSAAPGAPVESIEISSSFGNPGPSHASSGSFVEVDAEDVEQVQSRAGVGVDARTRRIRPDEVPSGAPPRDLRIGETLVGRYRLEKLIGKGGMGRVYLATQFPLNRAVAIKILNPEFQKKDPQFVRRFFLEAATAARLNHPNTITVFDYGETERGELFIAMEYLKGRPLSRVLSVDGPFHGERCLHICTQIVRALREAHSKGIIHRDLKPGNIMLLDEGDDADYAKVLDFGLVKLFNPAGADGVAIENLQPEIEVGELTRAGMFLGSPKYMSPEQIQGQDLDPRTDIYSLGVIMYQMLAGRVPFRGTTSVEIIYKHVNVPVPAIHDVNPEADCPPELELVIQRCLAKNRADRYGSMGDLLTALKDVRRLILGVSSISGSALGLDLVSHYPIKDTSQVAPELPPGIGFGTAGKMQYNVVPQPGPTLPAPPPTAPAAVPDSQQPAQREAAFTDVSPDDSASLELRRRKAEADRARGGSAVLPYVFGAIVLVGLGFGAYLFSSSSGGDPIPPVEPPQPIAKPVPSVAPAVKEKPPEPPAKLVTRVRFSSKPEGARVFEGATQIGVTPFELELVRSRGAEDRTFVFRKDGFLDETVKEKLDSDSQKILTTLRAKPVEEPPPRRKPEKKPPKREPQPGTEYKENPY